MSFLFKLYAKKFFQHVGNDKYGNKYYLGNNADYLGNKKRYVIYDNSYKKHNTILPDEWHSWLHYLSDKIPVKLGNDKFLLKDVQSSLSNKVMNKKNNSNVKYHYSAWKPY